MISANPLNWPGEFKDYVQGRRKGGITGSNPKEVYDAYHRGMNRDKAGNLGKLGGQGDASSSFAGGAERAFGQLGSEATRERDYLRKIARGDESVSAMQLQDALQQNQSAQQSMAAGARPGNAAMAARTAAMTAGRQGAGLAGQQAVAGIQERQSAQQSLANMLMQQRQQELQGSLGGRSNATNAFGTAYTGSMGQPTNTERNLGMIRDGFTLAAGV